MNTRRPLHVAVLGLLALTTPALRAQSIPNPGFEADNFTVWPGYANGNLGGISGWTYSGDAGLNPASGSPFANNGAVPQGSHVAFLQSNGNVPTTLGTTITNLTPGTAYTVRFRANQREGSAAPAPVWSLNGGAFVPFSAAPAVGGSNGYYYVSGSFTATGAGAALVIGNSTSTDTTLLVDNFTIALAEVTASAWSVSSWSNDATSGLSLGTQWAFRFGSAANTSLNGVPIVAVAGANPAVPGKFAVTGVPNVLPSDTNTLTALGGSGSADLAASFVYGGDPATLTIEGLSPGHTYVASLFSVGWDPTAHRINTFSSAGQQFVVDQDEFGNDHGVRVDCTFVAEAATRTITITPQDSGFTFHLYGLALQQPILVSNAADSGTGSLRWALAAAASLSGPDSIAFDPALSGQTISLSSEIIVNDPAVVTVDAQTLPSGITLSGGHATRILSNSGGGLILSGLSLVNGADGAIENGGPLTLTRCTLSGNHTSGGTGGAIYNRTGALTLSHCTLSGNHASAGGAIAGDFRFGPLVLTHCTISGNSSGGGAASAIEMIYGTLTLTNSIVAGNTTAAGPSADIYNQGTITRVGANIVQSLSTNGGSDSGPPAIIADPLLAPLANYGGPTPTMALRFGSPALDAAVGSTATHDQRGSPIVGIPDIGAHEGLLVLVSNTADAGTGSLRWALATAAARPGPDLIDFDPQLGGQTITLGSQLTVNDPDGVVLDAMPFRGGSVRVSGGHATRLLSNASGSSLTLRGLTLANGEGSDGGAISNDGRLTLTHCTLSGNHAQRGGAIFNMPDRPLKLSHCTLSGNSAAGTGGAIYNLRFSNMGALTLTHCTLSGNASGDLGGAIANWGQLTLTNSIVAGNTVPPNWEIEGDDIYNAGRITTAGANIIQELFNDTSAIFSAGVGTTTGPPAITADPLLAPLSFQGGPTDTMLLGTGSPAIGAAIGSTATRDQRGYPVLDIPDLGAYEAVEVNFVWSTADSGYGSLRWALASAAVLLGPDLITFDPGLSGQTITLDSEIRVNDPDSVTVIAIGLTGLTISGGNATRLFTNDGGGLTLYDLTLANGEAGLSSFGGAIENRTLLTLTRCTLSDNHAADGGAIYSRAGSALTLTHCTLSGNNAADGGAIQSSSATLTHCTFSGNHASQGGAITNHGNLTLTNSIVAGNTTSSGNGDDDIYNWGYVVRAGANIVQSLYNDGFGIGSATGPAEITADPLLAPLGDYGGPTHTMALRPGSPARDAAVGSTATSDQRGYPGFPIIGVADIGAYEAGTFASCATYLAESLPASATPAQLAPGADFDNDGATNGDEWLALTDPASPVSLFIPAGAPVGENYIITFPTAIGRTYTLRRSDTLLPDSWTTVPGEDPLFGIGSIRFFTVPVGGSRRFYRVEPSVP